MTLLVQGRMWRYYNRYLQHHEENELEGERERDVCFLMQIHQSSLQIAILNLKKRNSASKDFNLIRSSPNEKCTKRSMHIAQIGNYSSICSSVLYKV